MNQNNRILVVDDSEYIHEDFRKILNPNKNIEEDYFSLEEELFGKSITKKYTEINSNYEIDFAFNGEQAYEMVEKSYIENSPYAIVFMDIRMPPGLDGIETISMIWEKYPNIEMVICSAYSDYSWEEIINKLGQNDKLLFLKKPFEAIEVKQMTLSLIKKYNLNQKVNTHVSDLEDEVNKRTKQLKAMVKELMDKKDKIKQESFIKNDIEKQLENEKNMLLSILEEIGFGIINTDTDNNIIFLNNKAEFFISKTKDILIGENILEVLNLKDKNSNIINIEDIHKDEIYKLSNFLVSIYVYMDKNISEISNIFLINEIEDIKKTKDTIKMVSKNLDLFLKNKDETLIHEIKLICNNYLNIRKDTANLKEEILESKKILICDRNKDISNLLKSLLDELNFSSKIINSEDLIKTIETNRYDFVILDCCILFESEEDLIELINQANSRMKIIVSVPYENKDFYNFSEKVYSIISKPFDFEDIKKSFYL